MAVASHWAALQSVLRTLSGSEAAPADSLDSLRLKEKNYAMAASELEKERAQLLANYQRACAAAGGAVSEAEDELFWGRLQDLDKLKASSLAAQDQARLLLYFPAPKYTHRLAAPGVYLGAGDYWFSQLAAGVDLVVSPGIGSVWDLDTNPKAGTPPSIRLSLSPIALSLHVDHLGLRGDNIPSAISALNEMDMSVELNVHVTLVFAPVNRSAAAAATGAAGAAAAAAGARRGPAHHVNARINNLANPARFAWQVQEGFRFEISKLDFKTSASLPVPTSLIRYVLNSLLPPQIKSALTAAVPQELGVLLSLCSDHMLRFSGDIHLASLPLETLKAALDAAAVAVVASSAEMAHSHGHGHPHGYPASTAAGAAASGFRTTTSKLASGGSAAVRRAAGGLKHALQERMNAASQALAAAAPAGVRSAGAPPAGTAASGTGAAGAPTASPLTAATPASAGLASRLACDALGISPLQAYTFVSALQAAGGAGGGWGTSGGAVVPPIKTLLDLLHFSARFNPLSHQRRHRAARDSSRAGAVVNTGAQTAAAYAAQTAAAGGSAISPVAGAGVSAPGLFSGPDAAGLLPGSPAYTLHKHWQEAQALLQRIADAYVEGELATELIAVAGMKNVVAQGEAARAAQAKATASYVDVQALFAAVEHLATKPVGCSLTIRDFLARGHAENFVGLATAIQLRLLREKQQQVASSAGKGAKKALTAGPVVSASATTTATPARPASTPGSSVAPGSSAAPSAAASDAAPKDKRGSSIFSSFFGTPSSSGAPASKPKDTSAVASPPVVPARGASALLDAPTVVLVDTPSPVVPPTTGATAAPASSADAGSAGSDSSATTGSGGFSIASASAAAAGDGDGDGGASGSATAGAPAGIASTPVKGGHAAAPGTAGNGGSGTPAGGSSITSPSSASVAKQIQDTRAWADLTHRQLAVVHTFVSRITASLSCSLTGGERGRISACARQLQLEFGNGIALPVAMAEGFFPPSTLVTVLESRDERSPALGWAAHGAPSAGGTLARVPSTGAGLSTGDRARAHSVSSGGGGVSNSVACSHVASIGDAGAENLGRGSYCVMLAWPRVNGEESDGPSAAGAPALEAADSTAPVSKDAPTASDVSGSADVAPPSVSLAAFVANVATGPAADGDVEAMKELASAASKVAPAPPSTTEAQPPAASSPAAAWDPSQLSPGDVEVVTTIKLHRLWAGLRIDEAALLRMVEQRADAQRRGLLPTGRGLPALHALELSFKPAVFGSSYSKAGMDAETASRLASQRADSGLHTSIHEFSKPPAFPYVIGIETPPWTRACLEVAALEAFGDVPILAKQVGTMLQSVWAGAMADAGVEDDADGADSSVDDYDAAASPPADAGPLPPAVLPSPSIATSHAAASAGTAATSRKSDTLAPLPVGVRGSFNGASNVGSFSATPRGSASLAGADPLSSAAIAAVDAALEGVTAAATGKRPSFAMGPPGGTAPAGPLTSLVAAVDNRSRAGSSVSAISGAAGGGGGSSASVTSASAVSAARALQRQRAVQALSIVSADVSTRIKRYLKSDDMQISLNVFVSVLSVPAPPLTTDDGDEIGTSARTGSSSAGGAPSGRVPLDETVLLVMGANPLAGGKHKPAGTGGDDVHSTSGGSSGGGGSHPKQVLSLAFSSRHSLQPSLIPPAGSALLSPPAAATSAPTAPTAASGTSAATSAAAAMATLPAVVPVTLLPAGSASGTASGGVGGAPAAKSSTLAPAAPPPAAAAAAAAVVASSNAPVLTAPAVAITLHISLLTLADDLSAITAALSAASSLQASVQ